MFTKVFDILLDPYHGCECCVPSCKSDYRSQVKDTKTTFHKFWKEWENKIYRGRKWTMTIESIACSKNFKESNFVYHINDTNNCRKWTPQKEEFKNRYVKKGVYSTKFPNCSSYLLKKKPAERSSLGSSDAREKISAQRSESKQLSELEAKTVQSINDICSFLNESHFVELTALECKIKVSRITFYKIGYNTFLFKYSFLKYSLVTFDDLHFKIWYGDESMSLETVANIVSGRKISLFDKIIEILKHLKALCSHPHLDISDEVNACTQKPKNLEDNVNLNIRSKLQFIVEQLQLALLNIKHHSYSPNLLSICVL